MRPQRPSKCRTARPKTRLPSALRCFISGLPFVSEMHSVVFFVPGQAAHTRVQRNKLRSIRFAGNRVSGERFPSKKLAPSNKQ